MKDCYCLFPFQLPSTVQCFLYACADTLSVKLKVKHCKLEEVDLSEPKALRTEHQDSLQLRNTERRLSTLMPARR